MLWFDYTKGRFKVLSCSGAPQLLEVSSAHLQAHGRFDGVPASAPNSPSHFTTISYTSALLWSPSSGSGIPVGAQRRADVYEIVVK